MVSAGHGRGRVLVMDDEPSVRTLAANMLEFLGYDAEIVDNGSAAIERFKRAPGTKHPFDAVMLDLVVPGDMGARETISQLTGIDPAVRAVVVSGYAQDAAVSSYRDYGFVAAMNKPVHAAGAAGHTRNHHHRHQHGASTEAAGAASGS